MDEGDLDFGGCRPEKKGKGAAYKNYIYCIIKRGVFSFNLAGRQNQAVKR